MVLGTVLFRADGNSAIGSGHIMRCLSIADALTASGRGCVFVLAGDEMGDVVCSRGYKCMVLETDYRDMESEIPMMESIVRNAGTVVVDSYYVTEDYLKRLREFTDRLVYIDDLATFSYPCDILINYNIYGADWEEKYRAMYADADTAVPCPEVILGPLYAPLRREFVDIPERKLRNSVTDILISTGGSDDEHIALRLIKEINLRGSEIEGLIFHFVIGALNTDIDEIKSVLGKDERICLHFAVKDMSTLMSSCDVALAAAGSTLYELCATQTPTVTYALADNQLPGGEGFERHGVMKYLGDARVFGTYFASTALDAVIALAEDNDVRQSIAHRMREVVDGRGAERIAEKLNK